MLYTKGELNFIIEEVEVYKYNIFAERHFSFGTWTSRQHAFVRIVSKDETGFGENIISTNVPEISLEEWGGCLKAFIGLSIKEAIELTRTKYESWGGRCCEMAEMALIDLGGKLLKQSALDMLNLIGDKPVFGVYVILSDDVEYVKEHAKWAYDNKRATYIKVKLFGDLELDSKIIKAVRENTDENTFLIGDVNTGYGKAVQKDEIDDIAKKLNILFDCGLDACEDPAAMSHELWIELQGKVGKLNLIPDEPMRPARVVINENIEGMGRIYNIHPGCMESIIDAVNLSNKIKELGAKLMIGDDSLIGPACTVWQQLAIGLEADWVEAIEKAGDSDNFNKAIIDISTTTDEEGRLYLNKNTYGFGLSLDISKLKEDAVDVITYR
ncbi:hypothetical protein [Vallitalea sp.]|jgi:hypothetical protein|uniref:hypothetical protein n=1 Tax=Vallitalea sp. TaxID=1882829 RepID=UPI0025DBC917|nr:hypothetical protein [Vallitalea sp.]MCT4688827.1 hypothetical protein [Vallitalea sp.]